MGEETEEENKDKDEDDDGKGIEMFKTKIGKVGNHIIICRATPH